LTEIRDVKKVVEEISSIYTKVRNLLTALLSTGLEVDKSMLSKFFEQVEREPQNVVVWQSFYKSLKAFIVKQIMGINCDDVVEDLDVDPALTKVRSSDNVKRFILELTKNDKIRVKLCKLVQNATFIENLNDVFERGLNLFDKVYDTSDDTLKKMCRDVLMKSIESTIIELDISMLGQSQLWDRLKVSRLEHLVKYGVTKGGLESLLSKAPSTIPLTLHTINQLIRIQDSINSCEIIEKTNDVLDNYNRVINTTGRVLNLLRKILEAYNHLQEAQAISTIYTRLNSERSLNVLEWAFNAILNAINVLKGIDKILDVILTKARGDRISIAEIYNSLDVAERSQGMNKLIELCLKGVLECTVNISL
jgi:hypothetical protein